MHPRSGRLSTSPHRRSPSKFCPNDRSPIRTRLVMTNGFRRPVEHEITEVGMSIQAPYVGLTEFHQYLITLPRSSSFRGTSPAAISVRRAEFRRCPVTEPRRFSRGGDNA